MLHEQSQDHIAICVTPIYNDTLTTPKNTNCVQCCRPDDCAICVYNRIKRDGYNRSSLVDIIENHNLDSKLCYVIIGIGLFVSTISLVSIIYLIASRK